MPPKESKSKKPHAKKTTPVKAWSIYPVLHRSVLLLIDSDGLSYCFNYNDDATNSTQDYDTYVMGRFTCKNTSCASGGWSSKKIPITIRLYPHNRYNARVYHQRCQHCNWLSRPFLDESYAERIAYRLRKWSGVAVETPAFDGKKSQGPHLEQYCEGCKDGHCSARF